MDTIFIRSKILKEEYDLSAHAHQERQEEGITIEQIEQTLLKGDISKACDSYRYKCITI